MWSPPTNLLLALALHGLILGLPVRSRPVPITILRNPAPSASVSLRPVVSSVALAALPEPSAPINSFSASPDPSQTLSQSPTSLALPVDSPRQGLSPSSPAPLPELAAPSAVMPQSTSEPLPLVSTPPVSVPESPDEIPKEPAESVPYADFPHLEAATHCPDLTACWHSQAASWRAATHQLKAQLESQGYELKNITDSVLDIDTGVQIYAVLKDGVSSYYLNLASIPDGILYTLTEQPMTQNDLNTLKGF